MKDLVEFLVKNLVSNPDGVEITELEKEKEIVYTIKVDDEDFGKIIGRSGKVATALRTVIKTASKKQNKRVFVKFAK